KNRPGMTAPMRLLDRIDHCHAPLIAAWAPGPAARFGGAGASPFAEQFAGCPLRYVLGDDLTQASAELAYGDGARLVGCLDLLRMPAPHLWIEWNDGAHKRVIYAPHSTPEYDSASAGRKVGIMLRASADGLT